MTVDLELTVVETGADANVDLEPTVVEAGAVVMVGLEPTVARRAARWADEVDEVEDIRFDSEPTVVETDMMVDLEPTVVATGAEVMVDLERTVVARSAKAAKNALKRARNREKLATQQQAKWYWLVLRSFHQQGCIDYISWS